MFHLSVTGQLKVATVCTLLRRLYEELEMISKDLLNCSVA